MTESNKQPRQGRRLPVFHLGLPKTATTMLQRCIFAQHSQLEYLGRVYNPRLVPHPELGEGLIRVLTNAGSPAKAKLRHGLTSLVEQAAAENRRVVFSEEGLTNGSTEKKRRQAQRIGDLMGDCKIVICVREPFAFLESLYFQQLKKFNRSGGLATRLKSVVRGVPRHFTISQWLDALWRRNSKTLGHLRVADTADVYAEEFGKENVRLLVFEDLVDHPDRFLGGLSRFIDVDSDETKKLAAGSRKNDRWREGMIERLKQGQHSPAFRWKFLAAKTSERWRMLGSEDPHVMETPKARAPVPPEWRERVMEVVGPQIDRLTTEWGLPLSRYGYPETASAQPALRAAA